MNGNKISQCLSNVEQKQYETNIRLFEYAHRKKIDIDAAVDKEERFSRIKINSEYNRIYLQERRKEIARARYEAVTILSDGHVELTVKNSFVPIEKREVTNFRIKSICRLQSEKGDDGLIKLDIQIGERSVKLVLANEKVGRSGYLLRKFSEVGMEVRIEKTKDKINFLNSLWNELLNRCRETIIIPTDHGWIKYKDKFIFVEEGEPVWKDLMKKAK